MRRFLAAVGAAGLVVTSSLAASPTPVAPPSGTTVEALIGRLSAATFADRQAATRDLLKAGPDALPALDRAASNLDPETRDRATRIAEQIRKSADAAKLVTAAPITLDYDARPLGAVIEDFKSRTGIPIAPDITGIANPLRRVTINTGPLPPWQALEELCRAAGLREAHRLDIPPSANRGRVPVPELMTGALPGSVPLLLVDGTADRLPGDRSTAVRVMALPPQFSGNRLIRGAGEVLFYLDVTPLPALRWQEVTSLRVYRAEDETGRSLPVSYRQESQPGQNNNYDGVVFFGGMGGQVMWMDEYGSPRPAVRPNPRLVPIKLRTNDRAVTHLRLFEGVVVGQINVPNQVLIPVPNLSAAVGSTIAGPNDTRLTVVGCEMQANGNTEVRLRTEMPNPWTQQRLGFRRIGGFPAMNSDASGGLTASIGALRFYDAEGKQIKSPRVTGSTHNDDGIRQTQELILSFPRQSDIGPPARLEVIGSKPVTVEVPFHLENVRLP